ncbi:MAG: transcriptional regulator [Candidatus Firestonebacteria bacterium RIFOXYC2_FULL_39_67]|nr:MAG: transcriptional regulator [Candidatus Firestonebacteria bacterium RIFOXYD2_FULL_39_29]OGF56152.1 MAG: transcriptional regulator [Candidatus Firestonebacteria bacterium RIFOXYC2_FULL_39_67]
MELRESEVLEFKKSTSELKEAVISIVSILNKHQKGELYFGVKNDGEIVGQTIGASTLRDISQAISNHIEPKIYPSINLVNIESKSCIKIEFQGEDIPYHAYGRVYIRVADEDKQLSPHEIRKVIIRKHNDNYKWESDLSDYDVKMVSVKDVKSFINKAKSAKRINFGFSQVKIVLNKLDLIRNNKLLKAVEPLFCNNNSFEVQVAVFAGTDKITFLDIDKITGNLFDILEKSEAYIREHINWGVKFGKLEREEIPEIPIKAIREALVNSLCHRDYAVPKGNEVAVFKNRIEIYNPGEFPKEVSPEDFITGKERSILRNPLIAEVFYKAKEIEKWGSGLKRINDECKAANVKVEFKILKTGFMVVFYRLDEKAKVLPLGPNTQKTHRKHTENAQETHKKHTRNAQEIIDAIKMNSKITRKQLSIKTGMTESSVIHYLRKLQEEGTLKHIGSTKSGYWEVMDADKK